MASREIQINAKTDELKAIIKKIDKLEERLMNEEIESETYKRWFKEFTIEKSTIQSKIDTLQRETSSTWNVSNGFYLD